MRALIAGCLLLVGATPATASKLDKLQAMTPQDFASKVVKTDDPLETQVTFSTAKAFRTYGSLNADVNSDVWISASIDRKSNVTQFQIVAYLTYIGDWKVFDAGNFVSSDGPHSDPLVVSERVTAACVSVACSHTEIVGLPVSETILRAVAATYAPKASPLWPVRFKASHGNDADQVIAPAEAAGILAMIDAYRAAHPQ